MHVPNLVIDAPRKLFTLSEANRSLVFVSRVVQDIVTVYRQIMMLRREMDTSELAEKSKQACDAEKAYDEAMNRLGALVEELNTIGIELRDFELGIVDFPAQVGERFVCWCWRLGESEVSMWHDAEDSYSGRKPVSALAG